jgi:hypothetical protein
MEKRKHQVRVSSPRGGAGENPVDDGHSWRKYGQKEILGTKHPRLVFCFPYLFRSQSAVCEFFRKWNRNHLRHAFWFRMVWLSCPF